MLFTVVAATAGSYYAYKAAKGIAKKGKRVAKGVAKGVAKVATAPFRATRSAVRYFHDHSGFKKKKK